MNTVDLSEKAYEQDILYTFSIDQPMVAGVYLLVQNINTQYIEVTLVGPNNYSHVILHGEGYTAAQDSPHIEELLHPGHYQVTLTSQQSPGSIAVYVLH